MRLTRRNRGRRRLRTSRIAARETSDRDRRRSPAGGLVAATLTVAPAVPRIEIARHHARRAVQHERGRSHLEGYNASNAPDIRVNVTMPETIPRKGSNSGPLQPFEWKGPLAKPDSVRGALRKGVACAAARPCWEVVHLVRVSHSQEAIPTRCYQSFKTTMGGNSCTCNEASKRERREALPACGLAGDRRWGACQPCTVVTRT